MSLLISFSVHDSEHIRYLAGWCCFPFHFIVILCYLLSGVCLNNTYVYL